MFHITGRLESKSLIREGENEYGKWQMVEFVIYKSYKKKKIRLAFVAFGKLAKEIQEIPHNERITVHFYPNCRQYKNKYYTELKAEEVHKYVSRRKAEERIVVNGEMLDDADFLITPDNQLFDTEENNVQNTDNQEEKAD